MRIAFVADARSPIARNWISYFVGRGDEVFVISSYPCAAADRIPEARQAEIPLAFAALGNAVTGISTPLAGRRPRVMAIRHRRLIQLLEFGWNWAAPAQVRLASKELRVALKAIDPDVIHAMRIPFEGMTTAHARMTGIPCLISIWGNDITLQARRNPLMMRGTHTALRAATAILADCHRDIRLAHNLGFDLGKPARVLPGGGGVQMEQFRPGTIVEGEFVAQLALPAAARVVINPRGFRSYVRNDTFFQAIPFVLHAHPDTVFLCVGMRGSSVAERWVKDLGIAERVRLLPQVSRAQMADLFRLADVTVSPSIHDGTPNSLLEGMASGAFPVAGDLDSVREWITDGVNGLLCDATDPGSIARSINQALAHQDMRSHAQAVNLATIAERADYQTVMSEAAAFYRELIEARDQKSAAA